MNIKDIKELCDEHSELLKTNSVLKKALENRNWIKVSTPMSDGYITRDIAEIIIASSNLRIKEIELMLEDKYINVEKL